MTYSFLLAMAACFAAVGWILRCIWTEATSPRIARMIDRDVDIRYKWPRIKEETPDIDDARTVFAFHVFEDPSWTTDLSPEEIKNVVFNLE